MKKTVSWLKCNVSPNPPWGWMGMEACRVLWYKTLGSVQTATDLLLPYRISLGCRKHRKPPGSSCREQRLLGPSVPQVRSLLCSSKAGPGRDHPADCGKGLHESPSGKLIELSQLLWGWLSLSCKHTPNHENATHSPERLCPLGSRTLMDDSEAQRKWEQPGSGQRILQVMLYSRQMLFKLTWLGRWGSGECTSRSSESLLALNNPATCSLSKAMHVSKGCKANLSF